MLSDVDGDDGEFKLEIDDPSSILQGQDEDNSLSVKNKLPKKSLKSWSQLKHEIHALRRSLWYEHGTGLPQSFTFHHHHHPGGSSRPFTRIYFTNSGPPTPSCPEVKLYCINVPDAALPLYPDIPGTVWYPWTLACSYDDDDPFVSLHERQMQEDEEELILDRKRNRSDSNWYGFDEPSAKFLFSCGSVLFQAIDKEAAGESEFETDQNCFLVVPELIPSSVKDDAGANIRINPKICPFNSNLIAFVRCRDIWVVNTATGIETQLTHVHDAATSDGGDNVDGLSAGLPSYVIQEEFNRFDGFWWQPTTTTTTTPINHNNNNNYNNCRRASPHVIYRLLYEEVDESGVNILRLLSTPDKEPELHRFPHAGSPNAISTLKLFEITTNAGPDDDVAIISPTAAESKTIVFPIKQYFDWTEYLVRVGWTPNGQFVWTQLLDRAQTRLQLVLWTINPASSVPVPIVIYSESCSDNSWLNVHDLLEFISIERGIISFIWASEETGYRHLYYVESYLHSESISNAGGARGPNLKLKLQLTSGPWMIHNTPKLSIQPDYQFIFFHASRDSPTEKHVYGVSYRRTPKSTANTAIKRLSTLGSSYEAIFSSDCSLAVFSYSNLQTPSQCKLFRLIFNGFDVSGIELELLTYFLQAPAEPELEPCRLFSNVEILTHQVPGQGQEEEITLYSTIYKPLGMDPTLQYPTILNIYGGPEIQLVTNTFHGVDSFWIHMLTSQGYIVVNVDSRGSAGRGSAFESCIKYNMGNIELEDQLDVLNQLIAQYNYIDKSRIGLYGWSYGGYLSLLGLAKYPEVFKVAIAGAPVTDWTAYDTGYTERYMGLPAGHKEEYDASSILNLVSKFPDQEGRLLIIHGLLDENVHFSHTRRLIDGFVKDRKPYQLQIYPNERHCFKRLESSEHYETTILCFLQRNL